MTARITSAQIETIRMALHGAHQVLWSFKPGKGEMILDIPRRKDEVDLAFSTLDEVEQTEKA